ncbi:nucleoporin [Aspergillus luchuensis]|uniref:Nucleoporin n=1 Tax=Aspergillus kawachii TaxID=1069201 RepID=A0A146FB40_ASPKA|nr:nucleoporin [Aspergillus luchuensis]
MTETWKVKAAFTTWLMGLLNDEQFSVVLTIDSESRLRTEPIGRATWTHEAATVVKFHRKSCILRDGE